MSGAKTKAKKANELSLKVKLVQKVLEVLKAKKETSVLQAQEA